MTPANTATRHAPSTPPATPPLIHRPRCGTERVTAITMPTTRPASNTSRKTMIRAASTATSFHHECAAIGLIEIVEEFVFAGLERADAHDALAIRGDHLFGLELLALEFHRGGVAIGDADHDAGVRRRLDLGRLELLVLHGDLNGRVLRQRGSAEHQAQPNTSQPNNPRGHRPTRNHRHRHNRRSKRCTTRHRYSAISVRWDGRTLELPQIVPLWSASERPHGWI